MNLFLLRHAESPSSTAGDRERILSPHGKEQARNLGKAMMGKGYRPDFVLCSAAKRTQQTWEGVKAEIGKVETLIAEEIYHAGPDDLIEIIQSVPERYQSVLLVGHNPSIHMLAGSMATNGPEEQLQQLTVFYKPCTLSVIDCPVEAWKDLRPGQGTLKDLIIPD